MKKFSNNDEFSKEALNFYSYLLIDRKYSEKTIESYMNDLYKFYEYTKNNKLNFNEIQKKNIIEYQKYLNKLIKLNVSIKKGAVKK